MKKISIVLIAILMVLGGYNVVQAITHSELEQKRIELKTKIEEAGKNIESIEVELTQNLEAINALDKEIYLYEEQVNTISENLRAIEKQIDESETILDEVEKQYEYQKRFVRKKIAICI